MAEASAETRSRGEQFICIHTGVWYHFRGTRVSSQCCLIWDRLYRGVLRGDLSTSGPAVEDHTGLHRAFKVVLDISVQLSESHLRLILCTEGGQMKEAVMHYSMSKLCSEDWSSGTRFPTQRITLEKNQRKYYRLYQLKHSVLTCSFYSGNSHI